MNTTKIAAPLLAAALLLGGCGNAEDQTNETAPSPSSQTATPTASATEYYAVIVECDENGTPVTAPEERFVCASDLPTTPNKPTPDSPSPEPSYTEPEGASSLFEVPTVDSDQPIASVQATGYDLLFNVSNEEYLVENADLRLGATASGDILSETRVPVAGRLIILMVERDSNATAVVVIDESKRLYLAELNGDGDSADFELVDTSSHDIYIDKDGQLRLGDELQVAYAESQAQVV